MVLAQDWATVRGRWENRGEGGTTEREAATADGVIKQKKMKKRVDATIGPPGTGVEKRKTRWEPSRDHRWSNKGRKAIAGKLVKRK